MAATGLPSDLSLIPTDPAYQAIFAREEHVLAGIRDGLIVDPLIDLILIDQPFWRKFTLPATKLPNLVTSDVCSLLKNSWAPGEQKVDIGTRLRKLDKYITPHSIVAGGAVFSILFGLPVNDVDIFFVGAESAQANDIIDESLNAEDVQRVTRSDNAVSINVHSGDPNGVGEVQYILRLYKSLSEVIHGFDVDCCCMDYDGANIWITIRGLDSLQKGYNTLTKERMSPSYEYRLLKYAYRGMPILIPGFDHHSWAEDQGFEISNMGSRQLRAIIREELKNNRRGFRYVMAMAQMVISYPRGAVQMLHLYDKSVSDYRGTGNKGSWFGNSAMADVLGERYAEFKNEAAAIDDEGIYMTGKGSVVSYVIDSSEDSTADTHDIFNIPDDIFKFVQKYYPKYPPQEIVYKVVRPGEQATGSFHKTVLENTAAWWGN